MFNTAKESGTSTCTKSLFGAEGWTAKETRQKVVGRGWTKFEKVILVILKFRQWKKYSGKNIFLEHNFSFFKRMIQKIYFKAFQKLLNKLSKYYNAKGKFRDIWG